MSLRRLLATCALLSCGLIGVAHAGVATGVTVGGTSGEQATRAYSSRYAYTNPQEQQTTPGDSGIYTCYTNYCSPTFASGAVSSTGTTDTTGLLSSASDTISASQASDSSDATASSAANLAAGTLHDTAYGSYGYDRGGESYGSEGEAANSVYDTLTFAVTGASVQTVTDVTLDYRLTGSVSTVLYSRFQNAGLSYQLSLGDTEIEQSGYQGPGVPGPDILAYGPIREYFGGPPVSLQDVAVISDTPFETDLAVTYQLTGASVTADFYDGLGISCGVNVSCDFTSKVAFVLPSNVTLTSASGVFLTQAVPEPRTWSLMIAGLLLVGGSVRRMRRLALRRPSSAPAGDAVPVSV